MLLLKPLTRYFDFSGRASRKEFWLFSLALLVGWAALLTLDIQFGWAFEASGPLSLAFHYATLIPWLAVSARRLHDSDRSGAWILVWALPLIIMSDVVLSHPSLYAEIILGDFATSPGPLVWTRGVLYGGLGCLAIGFVWFLVLMCWRGTSGKNRFGLLD